MRAPPFALAPLAGVLVHTLIGGAPAARAADIVVAPGQSIQTAIQLAAPGDRVLVLPGTYAETIDFLGKLIDVVGAAGAAATVIDGGGAAVPVVTNAGAGAASQRRLEGFTIRNGTNGVACSAGAGLTIANCVLRAAVAGHGLVASGNGSLDLAVEVIETVIEDNPAGGVLGDVSMLRCTVRNNQGSGVEGKLLELTECVIADNVTAGSGGGVNAHGGLDALSVKLERTTVSGNVAGLSGGGVSASSQSLFGGVSLASCSIVGNRAPCAAGAALGTIDHHGIFGIGISCTNVIFAGNVATSPGCAGALEIALSPLISASAILERCTFVGNAGSGLTVSGPASIVTTIRHSIFWNQPEPFPATAQVTDCDVQGGAPGAGNFSADPLFADLANLDLHLLPGSPCIDLFSGSSVADFEGDAPAGPFDCGADEFRPRLYYTGVPVAGGTIGLNVVGPAGGAPLLYFASLSRIDPGVPTPYGPFQLGLPLIPGFPVALGALPASGLLAFAGAIPAGVPSGLALHTQAFVGGPGAALTNCATILFE